MLPMTLKLPSIKLILSSVFLVFSLSGCELLNEEINECINKIRPKLPPKILVQGQVGVPYFESIQAEVKNANDDAFDYEFSLDSGSLPPNIGYQFLDLETAFVLEKTMISRSMRLLCWSDVMMQCYNAAMLQCYNAV